MPWRELAHLACQAPLFRDERCPMEIDILTNGKDTMCIHYSCVHIAYVCMYVYLYILYKVTPAMIIMCSPYYLLYVNIYLTCLAFARTRLTIESCCAYAEHLFPII